MRLFKLFFLIVIITFQFSNPLNAQSNYTPPKLSDPDSWTMIMLPDPQSYVKFGRNQGIFELMTAWI